MPQNLADLGKDMPVAPLAQPNNLDLSSLAQMLQLNRERMAPQFQWRFLDPGMTWGGRDRNAVQPDDVMRSYLNGAPSENI